MVKAEQVPSIGSNVGRFRLEQLLGQGASGLVFQAHDTLLDTRVCLKFLHPAMSSHPEVLARFTREVLLARRVTHPGICRLFDLHEEDGFRFLTMEYVEGKTLRDVLADEKVLAPDRAVRLVRNLALALDAAHEVGVVHRDLKPRNIMVRGVSEACILDFGIATALDVGNLTRPGLALGTRHYIAPEVWAGKPATRVSDVFSIGVIFYNCLTGRMPWSAEHKGGLLGAMMEGRPIPPSQFNADISRAIDTIANKAMAFDPAYRYQSARELADALDDVENKLSPASADANDDATEAPAARDLPTRRPPDIRFEPTVVTPMRFSDAVASDHAAQGAASPTGPTRVRADAQDPSVHVAATRKIEHVSSTGPEATDGQPTRVVRPVPAELRVEAQGGAVALRTDPSISFPPGGVDKTVIDTMPVHADIADLPDEASFVVGGVAMEAVKAALLEEARQSEAPGEIKAPAADKPKPKHKSQRGLLLATLLAVSGVVGGILTIISTGEAEEPSYGTEPGDFEDPDLVGQDAEANGAEANDAEANDAEANDTEANDTEANDTDEANATPPNADRASGSATGDASPPPEKPPAVSRPHAPERRSSRSRPPDRRRRQPSRVQEREPEARSAASVSPPVEKKDDGERRAYESKREALARRMADLGIRAGDLPAYDLATREMRSLAKQERWAEAGARADEARAMLAAVRIDEAFVAAKLKRFNRRFDRVRDESARKEARRLMEQVLGDLGNGSYPKANARLNQAFRALGD